MIRRGLVCAALLCCIVSATAAQRGPRVAPRYPTVDTFGHGFVFCRGIYTSTRGEAGGQGWSTDYPDADLNFSIRLSERTRTRVKFGADGRPECGTVRLTEDARFPCP